MKPAPFEYHRPGSTEEAIELLTAHADRETRILAGGQSLVPLMNLRLAQPEVIVDIGSIGELAAAGTANGSMRLGSMTRQQSLLEDPELRTSVPLLSEATHQVGHVQIRHRGTVGGVLAHADPAAEYPTVALALNARLEVTGPNGTRQIEADDFFLGPFMTAIEPNEMLTAAEFPKWPTTSSFAEVARRHGDFAIAAVAVALQLDGDRIARAGIGLGGVGGKPVRAQGAEELLGGQTATPALLDQAAEAAAIGISPSDDIHGSGDFRRHLVSVLTRRCLDSALKGTN